MREAIVILLVICLLLGLTAIRYRKQIAGILGIARMIKEANNAVRQGSTTLPREQVKSIPLVNCSKCGVWVPQNKAQKVGEIFYCSDECILLASRSN